MLREAIVKKLSLAGYGAAEFGTGTEALKGLEGMMELPMVVWLDYYLPDMNGMEFIQQLKANPKWAKIPVVVVSNSASPDVVGKMLDLGADEYLLKVDKRLEDIIKVMEKYGQG